MGDKAGKLLSDARDLVRRTNLQVLVVGGVLLLMWITTFEPKFTSLLSSRTAFAQQSVRLYNNKVELQSLDEEEKGLSSDFKEISRKLASCSLEDCGGLKQQANTIEKRRAALPQRRSELQNSAETIQQQIVDELATLVPFDLGNGWKLPFTLAYAPLIWLVVASALLVRVGFVRARFWQLVNEARSISISESGSIPRRAMFEIPLWLAPSPRRPQQLDSNRDIEAMVGWRNSSRYVRMVMLALLVALSAIVIRVTWLGLFFTHLKTIHITEVGTELRPLTEVGTELSDYAPPQPMNVNAKLAAFTAASRDWISEPGGAWHALLIGAIWFTAAVCLCCVIWLALRHRQASRVPRAYPVDIQRRWIIGSGAALAAVSLSASLAAVSRWDTDWITRRLDIVRNAFRYKKRVKAFSDLSGSDLQPGWYRNKKSGRLWLINPDKRVLQAKHLKAANLEPISTTKVLQAGEWTIIPFVTQQHAILEQLSAGRKADALAQARAALARRYFDDGVPRIFDLCAGLAIRFDDTALLDQTIGSMRRASQSHEPLTKEIVDGRIARWTGNLPKDVKWRQRRWGQEYPLHWDNKSINI
ncbi:hypothetical protein [Rhizobium leguminosarum]|uniref:hypothetical protein n=1 Tax=Rhizobium leguminosarum TaxID=384 RepID=UPI00144254B7|nr:hypothetical protein [Rhizobium leguminosarum]NKK82034.1 hypothetical protein [Rhizobium leguminosarum bv. viciae]